MQTTEFVYMYYSFRFETHLVCANWETRPELNNKNERYTVTNAATVQSPIQKKVISDLKRENQFSVFDKEDIGDYMTDLIRERSVNRIWNWILRRIACTNEVPLRIWTLKLCLDAGAQQ